MKQKSFFWLAGLTAVVGVGLITSLFFVGSLQRPSPPASPATHEREVTAPVQGTPSPQAVTAPKPQASVAEPPPPQRENVVPQSGGPAEAVVRIKPDRVLATVNGVSITLKDLVPLPKDKANTEQMLSAEMYDFLFNRAVQREVTFQAARAQGIELTDSQKERLAELRARSEAKPAGVFDTVGQNPENTEFEQRDFAGLALQAVLAEKAGVPSAYVTSEQVEEYFLQHKSDYAQIPTDPAQRSSDAWAAVDSDIRKKLTPALQAEHDRQLNKMMADLLAKANVVVSFNNQ